MTSFFSMLANRVKESQIGDWNPNKYRISDNYEAEYTATAGDAYPEDADDNYIADNMDVYDNDVYGSVYNVSSDAMYNNMNHERLRPRYYHRKMPIVYEDVDENYVDYGYDHDHDYDDDDISRGISRGISSSMERREERRRRRAARRRLNNIENITDGDDYGQPDVQDGDDGGPVEINPIGPPIGSRGRLYGYHNNNANDTLRQNPSDTKNPKSCDKTCEDGEQCDAQFAP